MGQAGQIIVAEPPARSAPPEHVPTEAWPAVLFRAAGLLCAVPVTEVIETMRPLPVHHLAGLGSYVSGVTVMRGRAAPVVDVARLLTGGAGEPATRFVAVRTFNGAAALATGPVVDIAPVAAAPVAATGAGAAVALVATIADEPLFGLHVAALVPDEVWAAIAGVHHPAGPDAGTPGPDAGNPGPDPERPAW